jgi:cytochrome d ubiquinol oxidase subunit I
MSVEILARIQFAFTIGFHYIYPPLSIGLGLILVILEGLYLRTKDKRFEMAVRFWIRIFALIFGIGVATGIIMEFEFGTNWAVYSKYVGDIFGSALAAEGIFAFALESGFLGVLIFGWNRVKPPVHFFSTIMVFCGSLFSAVWIVVANSWQQTPAGFHIVGSGMNARAEITDFWAMCFNPSSVDRILHVWIGAILAGAFLVLSVNAWYLLHGKHLHFFKSEPARFAIPLLMVLSIANIPRQVKVGKYRYAFISSAVTIALLLIMVALEVFPYLLYSPQRPADSITIYNAASSPRTMRILLIMALIGTPLVGVYTSFVFWTFKGKVRLDEMSY